MDLDVGEKNSRSAAALAFHFAAIAAFGAVQMARLSRFTVADMAGKVSRAVTTLMPEGIGRRGDIEQEAARHAEKNHKNFELERVLFHNRYLFYLGKSYLSSHQFFFTHNFGIFKERR